MLRHHHYFLEMKKEDRPFDIEHLGFDVLKDLSSNYVVGAI